MLKEVSLQDIRVRVWCKSCNSYAVMVGNGRIQLELREVDEGGTVFDVDADLSEFACKCYSDEFPEEVVDKGDGIGQDWDLVQVYHI